MSVFKAILLDRAARKFETTKELFKQASDKALRKTQMLFAASNVADAVSTLACISWVAGSHERNSLIAPNGHFSTAALVGVKLVEIGGLVLLNEIVMRTTAEPDRPEMRSFLKKANTAASGVFFAAAAYNASLLIPH